MDKISWDPTLSNNAEYNELVQNTFKNMIYANVYLGNYWGGLYYLDEYKKFKPDENFVEEWEARLKGNIVKIHEKYDWSFTGKMSSAYLKKQHQEMLNKIIDRRYSGDAKLKEELKNRIYPEFVITPEQKTTEEQKSSESK